MSTFKRCDETVEAIVAELKHRHHQGLVQHKVKIDLVFAFGKRDECSLEVLSPALVKNGVKCLGITRKMSLKDRVLGRGDAEIALDGDWWETASEDERRALLDHELHHLVPTLETDDIGRPLLKLRPHDYEFGWFKVVAERNGMASQERIQAARMMEESGQFFWPSVTVVADKQRVQRFGKIELKS